MLFHYLSLSISVCALSVSYVESRWNPKEHLFPNEYDREGDMRAPPGRVKRNVLDSSVLRWPRHRPIPIEINDEIAHGSHNLRNIQEAIKAIEIASCLRFRSRERGEDVADYIHFTNEFKGCWTHLGRQSGRNIINLGTGCPERIGIVIHYILHKLGFEPEHTRADRDKYITINWGNIRSGSVKRFNKSSWYDDQGLPYDFDSVMHYNFHAFSKNGRPTMVPKDSRNMRDDDSFQVGLSYYDIRRIDLAYCHDGQGQWSPPDLFGDALIVRDWSPPSYGIKKYIPDHKKKRVARQKW